MLLDEAKEGIKDANPPPWRHSCAFVATKAFMKTKWPSQGLLCHAFLLFFKDVWATQSVGLSQSKTKFLLHQACQGVIEQAQEPTSVGGDRGRHLIGQLVVILGAIGRHVWGCVNLYLHTLCIQISSISCTKGAIQTLFGSIYVSLTLSLVLMPCMLDVLKRGSVFDGCARVSFGWVFKAQQWCTYIL